MNLLNVGVHIAAADAKGVVERICQADAAGTRYRLDDAGRGSAGRRIVLFGRGPERARRPHPLRDEHLSDLSAASTGAGLSRDVGRFSRARTAQVGRGAQSQADRRRHLQHPVRAAAGTPAGISHHPEHAPEDGRSGVPRQAPGCGRPDSEARRCASDGLGTAAERLPAGGRDYGWRDQLDVSRELHPRCRAAGAQGGCGEGGQGGAATGDTVPGGGSEDVAAIHGPLRDGSASIRASPITRRCSRTRASRRRRRARSPRRCATNSWSPATKRR